MSGTTFNQKGDLSVLNMRHFCNLYAKSITELALLEIEGHNDYTLMKNVVKNSIHLAAFKIAHNIMKDAEIALKKYFLQGKPKTFANEEVNMTRYTDIAPDLKTSTMEPNDIFANQTTCATSQFDSNTTLTIGTSERRNSYNDIYQIYAQEVVLDLFRQENLLFSGDLTYSHRNQRKSSQCDSCESISSTGLLSPHSSADSHGIHHFADKLLYSLSTIEGGCNDPNNESIESLSILSTYRRSSAPELQTSSRRSSLKTVFESEISPGSEFQTNNLMRGQSSRSQYMAARRRKSTDERKGISIRSMENDLSQESYSDMLTNDILRSAYSENFQYITPNNYKGWD